MINCLLLPVLNERPALEKIIPRAKKLFEHILVVDGGSDDGSKELIRSYNIELLCQNKRGKANGIIQACYHLKNRNITNIAMIDSDGTCDIKEVYEYCRSNDADILIGNRFHAGRPLVMDPFSYLVNKMVSTAISIRCRKKISDVQSPFWIFNFNVFKKILPFLQANKFDLEVDIALQACLSGIKVNEVPIGYYSRIGKSKFTTRLRMYHIWKVIYHIIRRRKH